MKKKYMIAIAVIAIVIIAAVGIVLMDDDDDSDLTPTNDLGDTVRAYYDAVNDHNGTAAVNQTTDKFMNEEVKEYRIGTINYYGRINATFNLTTAEPILKSEAPANAVELRIAKLTEDMNETITDWAVVHVAWNATTTNGPYTYDGHCLMVEIGGEWYMDYDSMTTAMDQWYEAYSS